LYRQTEEKSVTPVTLWSNTQNYSPSARLNRTPMLGYAETREVAMAAFAK
jgi:hypothetical protein